MIDPANYINTDRYPVNSVSSPEFAIMIKSIQAKLNKDGCAVLKSFLRSETLADLVAESDQAAPNAHNSKNRTNPYFSKDDESLDPSHPLRRFYDRSNAFIPADNFGETSALRAIYEWPAFFEFMRIALDEPKEKFFRYSDPLADVIVNMATEGNGFPWHFDTNNFTVTLAI